MISTFRFTDNVQRNISRYVQVNKYGDCYDNCYTSDYSKNVRLKMFDLIDFIRFHQMSSDFIRVHEISKVYDIGLKKYMH